MNSPLVIFGAMLATCTYIAAASTVGGEASAPQVDLHDVPLLLAKPEQRPLPIPVDGRRAVYCEVPLRYTVLPDGSVTEVEVTDPAIKPRYARNAIANVSKWIYAAGESAVRMSTTITYASGDLAQAQRRGCIEVSVWRRRTSN